MFLGRIEGSLRRFEKENDVREACGRNDGKKRGGDEGYVTDMVVIEGGE